MATADMDLWLPRAWIWLPRAWICGCRGRGFGCRGRGFVRAAGWPLGVAEMAGGVLAVGFAVDYTVHLASAYALSDAHARTVRVADAATRMGPTVIGGAMTTAGATASTVTAVEHRAAR